MNRREVLQNFGLTIGGSILLPTWAKAWNSYSFGQTHSPNLDESLLAEIVEVLIPKTDTLGAKELGVHKFVLKMINDCYDSESLEIYKEGLKTVESLSQKNHNMSFNESSNSQKMAIIMGLDKLENSNNGKFLQLIKNLTIQGYLSSEYVLTNLLVYEFAPARYYGCVPATNK